MCSDVKKNSVINKPSIYGLTFDALSEWLVEHGEKKFRTTQIWEWLYQQRVHSFEEMTNLSKNTRELLSNAFIIQPLLEKIVQESQDGTVKFLFELPDNLMIETVMMKQEYGLSVCVTTQVGCNIGCTFCASGLLKKQRDLSSAEITAQIMAVQDYLDLKGQEGRVSHVVVMGIGEPFDNYESVMTFVSIINHPKGLAIGARHITVSTSGLVPKIYEFADNGLQINLAISLHAPNDSIRSALMKINNTYPIKDLMESVKHYIDTTNRRVTFEYILLDNVNDSEENALELAHLLRPMKKLVYVNLIPYNSVDEHSQYKKSSKTRMLRFYDVLKKEGINCVIRQEHGADIDAACGQLRGKQLGIIA